MIEYYDKRVKLRRLNIGDLVLCRITPTTKDSPHLDQIGKGLTRLSITQDKGAITWN